MGLRMLSCARLAAPLLYSGGHIHKHALTHIHGLSVLAFLDNFPYTLVKHENEIDSLGLKDGTADTNKCCQLPWQVSADNGSGQPNGTVAMSFLSNFLANICSPLLCVFVCGP